MVKNKGPASAAEYIRFKKENANSRLVTSDSSTNTQFRTDSRAGGPSFSPKTSLSFLPLLSRFARTIIEPTGYRNNIRFLLGEGRIPGTGGSYPPFTSDPLTTGAQPLGIAVYNGDIYYTNATFDAVNNGTLRRLNASTNTITTLIANTDTISGSTPGRFRGCAVDTQGNVVVSDETRNRVLYLPAVTETRFGISMTAGTPVVLALNSGPQSISFDSSGNVYTTSSTGAGSIVRIARSDGAITTLVSGITSNRTCFIDQYDNLYFGSNGNPSTEIYVRPTTNGRYFGRNMVANTLYLLASGLTGGISSLVSTDASNNLYFGHANQVKKIDFVTGAISIVAGTGSVTDNTNNSTYAATSGDDGDPLSATFTGIAGVSFGNNKLYVADGNRIREIDLSTSTVAGTREIYVQ